MEIRNEKDLKRIINEVLEYVLESTTEVLLDILQKNLMKYTYVSLPNIQYEFGSGTIGQRMPSFEFYDAFKKKDVQIKIKEATSEIFYDWQSMTVNKKTGRHWDGTDTRKHLADILNVDGFVAMKERGAFWDKTLEEVEQELDSIFRNEMRKRGLTVV